MTSTVRHNGTENYWTEWEKTIEVCLVRLPEAEKRENKGETTVKMTVAKNFPKLMKDAIHRFKKLNEIK